MKKILMVAALMIASVAMFAQNGRSIYQKYSDRENVSAVFISSAMFKIIGSIPDIEVEKDSVNLTPIIKSLKGLYILETTNPDIRESIIIDVNNFVESSKYELLMEAKDSGETVRIYTVGDEQTVESFVMLACEPEEITFICIDGKMARDDLDATFAEMMR
ncbi:MAG: DUF4252 domain-containing protein [Bacteroidales bacterium]|nr:DUF4252 domain-containing protein [Bacteroidales bacterium]